MSLLGGNGLLLHGLLACWVSGRAFELASLKVLDLCEQTNSILNIPPVPCKLPTRGAQPLRLASIRVAACIVGVIRHIVPCIIIIAASARQLGGVGGLLLLGALLQAALSRAQLFVGVQHAGMDSGVCLCAGTFRAVCSAHMPKTMAC